MRRSSLFAHMRALSNIFLQRHQRDFKAFPDQTKGNLIVMIRISDRSHLQHYVCAKKDVRAFMVISLPFETIILSIKKRNEMSKS